MRDYATPQIQVQSSDNAGDLLLFPRLGKEADLVH